MKEDIGKIESGIPIPPDGRGNKKRKYFFADMAIGDSILLPGKSRASLYFFKAANPEFAFVVRREGSNFRAWRVAK